MFTEAIFDDPSDHPSPSLEEDTIAPDLVREELRRIVTSRHFRTSRRGKEFLQYVVDQKIGGKGDLLKERLIGVEIFGRKPDYATGEDPVVRVQAGDVRRRLESYHADSEVQCDILIQIPVGSYAPVFLWKKNVQPHETSPTEASGASYALAKEANEAHGPNALPALELDDHPTEAAFNDTKEHGGRRSAKLWRLAIPVIACLALVFYLVGSYIHRSPEETLKAFWMPASVSSKPVLLCLPKPMVYRPSEKLFDRYRLTHPDELTTREAREDQLLPLDPTEPILWGDMVRVRNSGPGIGAVVAAVNISKLLAEQGIRFELRFGDEATYADMRDSPVVIVGAINTDWATQLTSGSHFVFDESRDSPGIEETVGAKRVWKMERKDGIITHDYGLITRQISGKAGQFLVQFAGISHFGTEAASDFLANEKGFSNELHSESINLQSKNLQIVVSTDITAGRAGPPHVVAVSSW